MEIMVIENQTTKTEMVYEMKNDYEIPTYEEFLKSYKVDEKVNYGDLNSESIGEMKKYGPCVISNQLNYDNCHCSSDELDRQLKIIRNKRELEALEREKNSTQQEREELIKSYEEKLREKEEIIRSWQERWEESDSQYQLGKLLTNLGIKVVAPRLSLELATNEIKKKIKDNPEVHSLKRKLNNIKEEVNKGIVVPIIKETIIRENFCDLIREGPDLGAYKKAFESLKNTINKLLDNDFRSTSLDSESGPTIEEVE